MADAGHEPGEFCVAAVVVEVLHPASADIDGSAQHDRRLGGRVVEFGERPAHEAAPEGRSRPAVRSDDVALAHRPTDSEITIDPETCRPVAVFVGVGHLGFEPSFGGRPGGVGDDEAGEIEEVGAVGSGVVFTEHARVIAQGCADDHLDRSVGFGTDVPGMSLRVGGDRRDLGVVVVDLHTEVMEVVFEFADDGVRPRAAHGDSPPVDAVAPGPVTRSLGLVPPVESDTAVLGRWTRRHARDAIGDSRRDRDVGRLPSEFGLGPTAVLASAP